MKPEEEYRMKIDPYFEKYFIVEREVKSTDKTSRIDYILRCKESNACFGVEVKNELHMRGQKFGMYLKQAERYSTKQWLSNLVIEKTLPIFITPAISNSIKQIIPQTKQIQNIRFVDGKFVEGRSEYYQSFHNSEHEHSNMNSFLGAFKVGEIRTINNMFVFIMNNKPIWRSKQSNRLHQINYNFLIK